MKLKDANKYGGDLNNYITIIPDSSNKFQQLHLCTKDVSKVGLEFKLFKLYTKLNQIKNNPDPSHK